MATKTGKIVADFTTSLATALSVGATTATLQSATDDDGVALPTGKYYLAIDGANSSKEHIYCTLTGTALTDIKSISRQGVETTGVVRAHRLGATVTLTDFAYIKTINDLVSGAVDLDATDPLKYDAAPTLTTGSNEIATVKYVDDVAIAGSPLATTGTAGISKMSYAPASAGDPIAVGDNDPRMLTQAIRDNLTLDKTNALSGTSGTAPSSVNKFVDNSDTGTSGANKVLRLDGTGKLPAVDGSQLTGLSSGSFSVNADETLNSHLTQVMTLYGTSSSTLQGWSATTLNQSQIAFNTIQANSSSSSSFAIAASPVGVLAQPTYRFDDSKVIRIKFSARILDFGDIKGMGLALTSSYADIYSAHTATNNGLIRFVWNTTTLYAQNSNGTSNTNTSITTGITGTDWNLYEIVFTPGVSAKFYVNGSLKATHTTNLPTTGTPSIAFGVNLNGRQIQLTSPVVSTQL